MNFLKSLLFYPMMFLRGVLQWGLRLVSGLCLIAGIGLLIGVYGFDLGQGDMDSAPWMALGVGFVLFMIGWFYDVILLRLNPHPDKVLFLD